MIVLSKSVIVLNKSVIVLNKSDHRSNYHYLRMILLIISILLPGFASGIIGGWEITEDYPFFALVEIPRSKKTTEYLRKISSFVKTKKNNTTAKMRILFIDFRLQEW